MHTLIDKEQNRLLESALRMTEQRLIDREGQPIQRGDIVFNNRLYVMLSDKLALPMLEEPDGVCVEVDFPYSWGTLHVSMKGIIFKPTFRLDVMYEYYLERIEIIYRNFGSCEENYTVNLN